MLQALFIAIALSIDSFSTGIAFGIKGIRVPFRSILVLDLISILLLGSSFFMGKIIKGMLPIPFTDYLSFGILFMIGLWYLIQGYLNYRYPKDQLTESIPIATLSIRSLGIAINVIRDPLQTDLDTSGTIDTKEAILLGLGLAIDSLAVGIALSITSMTIIFIILGLVSLMNLVFLLGGIALGKHYLGSRLKAKATFVPGLILLSMALIRLL